jgi:hypothetical protein
MRAFAIHRVHYASAGGFHSLVLTIRGMVRLPTAPGEETQTDRPDLEEGPRRIWQVIEPDAEREEQRETAVTGSDVEGEMGEERSQRDCHEPTGAQCERPPAGPYNQERRERHEEQRVGESGIDREPRDGHEVIRIDQDGFETRQQCGRQTTSGGPGDHPEQEVTADLRQKGRRVCRRVGSEERKEQTKEAPGERDGPEEDGEQDRGNDRLEPHDAASPADYWGDKWMTVMMWRIGQTDTSGGRNLE